MSNEKSKSTARRIVFTLDQLVELSQSPALLGHFIVSYNTTPDDPTLVHMAVARSMLKQLSLDIKK